jgi:hypothetical protein
VPCTIKEIEKEQEEEDVIFPTHCGMRYEICHGRLYPAVVVLVIGGGSKILPPRWISSFTSIRRWQSSSTMTTMTTTIAVATAG